MRFLILWAVIVMTSPLWLPAAMVLVLVTVRRRIDKEAE